MTDSEQDFGSRLRTAADEIAVSPDLWVRIVGRARRRNRVRVVGVVAMVGVLLGVGLVALGGPRESDPSDIELVTGPTTTVKDPTEGFLLGSGPYRFGWLPAGFHIDSETWPDEIWGEIPTATVSYRASLSTEAGDQVDLEVIDGDVEAVMTAIGADEGAEPFELGPLKAGISVVTETADQTQVRLGWTVSSDRVLLLTASLDGPIEPGPAYPMSEQEVIAVAIARGLIDEQRLPSSPGRSEAVIVPDVVGLDYQVATDLLYENGITARWTLVETDEADTGNVVGSVPAIGERLAPGERVTLEIAGISTLLYEVMAGEIDALELADLEVEDVFGPQQFTYVGPGQFTIPTFLMDQTLEIDRATEVGHPNSLPTVFLRGELMGYHGQVGSLPLDDYLLGITLPPVVDEPTPTSMPGRSQWETYRFGELIFDYPPGASIFTDETTGECNRTAVVLIVTAAAGCPGPEPTAAGTIWLRPHDAEVRDLASSCEGGLSEFNGCAIHLSSDRRINLIEGTTVAIDAWFTSHDEPAELAAVYRSVRAGGDFVTDPYEYGWGGGTIVDSLVEGDPVSPLEAAVPDLTDPQGAVLAEQLQATSTVIAGGEVMGSRATLPPGYADTYIEDYEVSTTDGTMVTVRLELVNRYDFDQLQMLTRLVSIHIA